MSHNVGDEGSSSMAESSSKAAEGSSIKADDVEKEEEVKETSETIDNLKKQINILSTRCSALEAQNILVAVQQLDLLAQGIAITLSILTLLAYWKLIWWMMSPSSPTTLIWSSSIYSFVVAIMERNNVVISSSSLVFDGIKLILQHPITTTLVKYVLAIIPYFHHKLTHGLAHRRFEVFAVAFIVIARVRLCRWRENMFMQKETETATETTRVNNGEKDEKHTTNSDVNIPDFGQSMTEDAIWEANYEISARFLYVSILRLRGLWTKSAQYISSRADFMPESYVRELKKLQDEAPSTPWNEIYKMLQRHPGDLLKQVTNISKTPIASASIGQIHTANLVKTGDKVVIKVQHPFARTLLLDDFTSLKIITRIVSWLEPEYEFMEILMKEWSVEARKELDFVNETKNLLLAKESLEKIYNNNNVVKTNPSTTAKEGNTRCVSFQIEIPDPIQHLCTRDVLVMTFCEGTRIDNIEQIQEWNLSKDAIMDAVAQTFAHMMYTTTIFNGDPHPGNIFVRPGINFNSGKDNKDEEEEDGCFTIILLDWGLAKCLCEQKRLAFCQMTYAASTFDFGLLLDSFNTIGLQMKRENITEDLEGVRFLLRDMAPRTKTRKRIKAKIKTDIERRKNKKRGEKVPMSSKAYPGEFFFFVRVNELLHGLGSRLKVEMTYLDVLKPYAERGIGLSTLYNGSDIMSSIPPEISVADENLNDKLQNLLLELKKNDKIAGAQVCVIDSNGRILSNVIAGHMGGLKKRIPMRQDALVLGFSCTKAIAATMAHIMVHDGYLSYDEPISERVWKEFCPIPYEALPKDVQHSLTEERWAWKKAITLRHILTHSAGLWSALPLEMTIKSMTSCESCSAAFEYNKNDTLLPTSRPGDQTQYHFMSFGWLVAGTLCGAYSAHHGKDSVTFEELYETILVPKLSPATLNSGFRPCGGNAGFPMAQTETNDIKLSRMIQMRREAEAMGEGSPQNKNETSDVQSIRESFRGKEFLLDQRIWNCKEAQQANVPAAGGRFSAVGLASFYHDLGSGSRVLNKETLDSVTTVMAHEKSANDFQGQTIMTSNNASDDGIAFGMGYQLICFENDESRIPSAFGHAGVGRSLGFHHKKSSISVGIMLNKADGEKDTTKKIVQAISSHFKW